MRRIQKQRSVLEDILSDGNGDKDKKIDDKSGEGTDGKDKKKISDEFDDKNGEEIDGKDKKKINDETDDKKIDDTTKQSNKVKKSETENQNQKTTKEEEKKPEGSLISYLQSLSKYLKPE